MFLHIQKFIKQYLCAEEVDPFWYRHANHREIVVIAKATHLRKKGKKQDKGVKAHRNPVGESLSECARVCEGVG